MDPQSEISLSYIVHFRIEKILKLIGSEQADIKIRQLLVEIAQLFEMR